MTDVQISNRQVFHSGCSCVLHDIYVLHQGYSKMHDRRCAIGTFHYDCQLNPAGLFM